MNHTPCRWRKSTRSATSGQCVEIARPGPIVAIRDSKNPTGRHLTIRPATFEAFLAFTRPDTTG
jgi:Domain of unknown function (DUF397)